MMGKGVYRLVDAARYAHLPYATLRSWFKGRTDGAGRGAILKSEYQPIDGDFAVSFLDLIEAYVARFFYTENIPTSRIRAVYKKMKREMGVSHPFAHADLCCGDGRIIIESDAALVDALDRQNWFTEMRSYLSHIEYGSITKLADRWNIAEGVVIDPGVGFGKPVVKQTGITTFVLAGQYNANDKNAPLVADLYGVKPSDVVNAVSFESEYGIAA